MKKIADKVIDRRKLFFERLEKLYGMQIYPKSKQSVRINTLKDTDSTLNSLKNSSLIDQQYNWFSSGYCASVDKRKLVDSDLNAEGKIYIQNAASWLPPLILRANQGDKILDLCAAPGGKTSMIAAITENNARILCVDNSMPRLAKLRNNLSRLGVTNYDIICSDISKLPSKIHGQKFDKILLDAPCSGEGMLDPYDDKAMFTWNMAKIKRLQVLQKNAICTAWDLLEIGGTLVYSTCTMAPEENEAVVSFLLKRNENAACESVTIPLPERLPGMTNWNNQIYHESVVNCIRIKPSENLESFFVAKIVKIA